MDFHVLIIIACVFLASFLSILFINRFFRGKTFEEVAAEKRLLAEKLYGTKTKRHNPGTAGTVQKKSNAVSSVPKQNKRKNSNPKTATGGILINKSEPVLVKENLVAEPLNTFELKPPKDVLELKRQAKEHKEKDDVAESIKASKAAPKEFKKIKQTKKDVEKVENLVNSDMSIAKEWKQSEEKAIKISESPKNQNNKQPKKKKTDNPLLPFMVDPGIITVNSIMFTIGRTDLTRSEIQILIDFLLNKQQDTVANHSEWSDDVVQKLRKKLEEKEKALEEEKKASAGIQDKLRELRLAINSERVQHNAAVKSYLEEIQAKKLEIQNLTQDMNDRMQKMNETKVRMQLQQQKCNHEDLINPQSILAQIEKLNETNDSVKKNAFISEIQEIIQPQNGDIITLKNEIIALKNEIMALSNKNVSLKKSLNEAENQIVRQSHEYEEEKTSNQLQISNLQSELESAKTEINIIHSNFQNKLLNSNNLNNQYEDLKIQYAALNNKYVEQSKECNELRGILNTTFAEKDKKLIEYDAIIRDLRNKESELLKEIYEQKEKNNGLRTKNWKLVEALKIAETSAVKSNSNVSSNVVSQKNATQSQEERIRELFQRLFPDAVTSSMGSALSLSFDQWIEQVVSTHIKQVITIKLAEQNSNNSKANNEHYSNNHTESLNNHEENSNSSCKKDDIILQNAQLKAQVEELKSVVINTANTLKNLETQALEQDIMWRSIVESKQEEIDMLQNLNRQAA